MVEAVDVDPDGAIVVSVRPQPYRADKMSCPHCLRRCPGYNRGDGQQRWRALDLATTVCSGQRSQHTTRAVQAARGGRRD